MTQRMRLLVAGLACAGAVLCVQRASAQDNITVTLPDNMNREQPLRLSRNEPDWISHADCVADDILSFPMRFGGSFPGTTFQVWVGDVDDDCTQENNRTTGSDNPPCWLVHESQQNDDNPTIHISVRDIAAENKQDDSPTGPGSGTRADCDDHTNPNPRQLSLFFMFVGSGGAVQGSHDVWDRTSIDLVGPTAPTDVDSQVGESSILLEWKESGATDLEEYRFYCDPPRGEPIEGTPLQPLQLMGDAGSGVDASTGMPDPGPSPPLFQSDSGLPTIFDGASPISDASVPMSSGDGGSAAPTGPCSSPNLVPGDVPDEAYFCGSQAGSSSIKGQATGLTNGIEHVVAVSAVDLVGNSGPLSETVCEVPQELDDFYELYRRAGGQGGGGFCSIGARRGQASAWLLSVLGLALIARRRRRR